MIFQLGLQIHSEGKLTTLHEFCLQSGCPDGYWPESGVVQGTDGSLYGTTVAGPGSNLCGGAYCGTVFKITTGDRLQHSTPLTLPQPPSLEAGVVEGPDGNFYGTTSRAVIIPLFTARLFGLWHGL